MSRHPLTPSWSSVQVILDEVRGADHAGTIEGDGVKLNDERAQDTAG
jgi:hypothetical protein